MNNSSEKVITVFVNDHPLRFVDSYQVEQWKGNTDSVFVAEKEMTVENAMNELEETRDHPGIIYMSANPRITWQVFISNCRLIEAAGGLVTNENGEYLVIFRHQKWDLPKGKLDGGETVEEAAIREVQEECGIKNIELIKPLQKTFHTYFLKGSRVLKKTNWFLMNATGDERLIPQKEEDIQKAEWMSKEKIARVVLNNTFAAIAELLKETLTLEA